jgi:general secretion pathway protein G
MDPSGNVARIMGAFVSNNSIGAAGYQGNVIVSPSPNPYTTSLPVLVAADGTIYDNATVATTTTKSPAWQNAQTYQIIAPGADRFYGIGGQYVASGNEKLPFVIGKSQGFGTLQAMETTVTATRQSLPQNTRSYERDNLSNFSPGRFD